MAGIHVRHPGVFMAGIHVRHPGVLQAGIQGVKDLFLMDAGFDRTGITNL